MKSLVVLAASIVAAPASAQVIFNTVNETTGTVTDVAQPTYKFSRFDYTQSTSTYRYAQSVPSPTTTTRYAPPYSEVAHLLGNVSTTTWGNWHPSSGSKQKPTDTDDPYGQAAWTQLWEKANPKNFTRGIYSTTVKPTPVPSKELVMPPSDPFDFPTDNLTFPPDFVFGVAGSAGQAEGAAADEGKGPSMLDIAITDDRPKSYVTNEHYYLYKQDIARMAAMGVQYYSLTIPWSRIMPFAVPGSPVNKQALEHYDDVINTLLDHGMKPIVSLLHDDTPLSFLAGMPKNVTHDLGQISAGYEDDRFIDAFVNYCKIVMAHYGDRVPMWAGFSEPYMTAANAQGLKHVIQANAKLYRFYHDELKGKGLFGIKFNNNFGFPMDPKNQSHVEAARRFQEIQLESLANPIFLGKDYPESYKRAFKDSGLNFTLSEKDLQSVANCSDFMGIDPYTVTVITPPEGGIEACANNRSHPLWPLCVVEGETTATGWDLGYRSQSYVYTTPTYIRSFFNYLWNTFRKQIFVGEFGFPVFGEKDKDLADQFYDTPRSIYFKSYLTSMLQAIHYDNVHIQGAVMWTYADNWEFGDYKAQWGLQTVNRTTQERHYKKSFFDVMDFFKQHYPW